MELWHQRRSLRTFGFEDQQEAITGTPQDWGKQNSTPEAAMSCMHWENNAQGKDSDFIGDWAHMYLLVGKSPGKVERTTVKY